MVMQGIHTSLPNIIFLSPTPVSLMIRWGEAASLFSTLKHKPPHARHHNPALHLFLFFLPQERVAEKSIAQLSPDIVDILLFLPPKMVCDMTYQTATCASPRVFLAKSFYEKNMRIILKNTHY